MMEEYPNTRNKAFLTSDCTSEKGRKVKDKQNKKVIFIDNIHILLVAADTYVAEDDLVGHQ